MPDHSLSPSDAVVICTRNRPAPLEETLQSIAAHPPSVDLLLGIVDASDPDALEQNRHLVATFDALPSEHWHYTGVPSSARQRNYGVDQLPSSVTRVHFIDDDVTIQPGYFEALSETLRTQPDVGGVGSVVFEDTPSSSALWTQRVKEFFLLTHSQPGRVLPSGYTTSAQRPAPVSTPGLRTTEWLNGCATYRRDLLEEMRFDATLTGYALLEDLDLSYRVGRTTRLVVQPSAQLHHRRASENRLGAERYTFALLIHRRWFVEKNLSCASHRIAFWWSMLGKFLILLVSTAPDRDEALRGYLQGLRTIWRGDHALLPPDNAPSDPGGSGGSP